MVGVQIVLVTYTPLNHLSRSSLWKEEKHYEIWMDKLPPWAERSNVTFYVIEEVPLTDTRSLGGHGLSLEREGFRNISSSLPRTNQDR